MYTSYFGLSEKPFSIAPNPEFLFMSDRHREALTHLTYGLGDTGGFVLLTGEVGTGKTTISRKLMEQLPDNTQTAFILNPTLSSHELLATICDELKIRYRKTGATLKTLTDKIQEKLTKNHRENIDTLLIVDEAQHLQPEVLEQLRLLTNLETNTKKLLQVILIGQPELQVLLKRRDLRQLAQRITARYHLLALTKEEVKAYVKHRLSVAHCVRDLFTPSAVNTLHKVSQGIPRIVNLICDRALVNAYSSNNTVVNKKLIIQSAQEALDQDFQLSPWWQHSTIKWCTGTTAVCALVFLAYQYGQQRPEKLVSIHQERQLSTEIDNNITVASPQGSLKTNDDEKVAIDTQVQSINTTDKSALIKTDKSNDTVTNIAPVIKKKLVQPSLKVVKESTNELTLSLPANTIEQQVPSDQIKPLNIDNIDGDVPEDLLAKFQQAIDDTNSENDLEADNKSRNTGVSYPALADMPQWVQSGVPSLEFDMHIYASDGKGWVRVNGRDRYEGDYIERDLLLAEIMPQQVVLTFRGEKFTLPALSTW